MFESYHENTIGAIYQAETLEQLALYELLDGNTTFIAVDTDDTNTDENFYVCATDADGDMTATRYENNLAAYDEMLRYGEFTLGSLTPYGNGHSFLPTDIWRKEGDVYDKGDRARAILEYERIYGDTDVDESEFRFISGISDENLRANRTAQNVFCDLGSEIIRLY